jgi:hypothetical protein
VIFSGLLPCLRLLNQGRLRPRKRVRVGPRRVTSPSVSTAIRLNSSASCFQKPNRLRRDVVRVHRSRIVNRAKVIEIEPSRDGDFRIKTIDGSDLGGSRRRHLLSA